MKAIHFPKREKHSFLIHLNYVSTIRNNHAHVASEERKMEGLINFIASGNIATWY